MASVARINVTPVKALGLHHPDEVELTTAGVAENRCFYLVDLGGRLFAGLRYGALVQVRAEYDPAADRLEVLMPDGTPVGGEISLGAPTQTDFFGRPVTGRVVEGPWADALSAYAGTHVRLVRADRPGDACDVHVATLVSDGSLGRLAEAVGETGVDGRRFRMLIELTGCEPHEEDTWADRRVRVGEAVLRVLGPVPRCAVTTQDPDTGVPNLDTLRAIRAYRGARERKKLDFGVYADVERPGRVRVGDAVEPL